MRRAGIHLHQSVQWSIESHLDPWPLAADLVIERLKGEGVPTYAQDRSTLEKAFRSYRFEGVRLRPRGRRRKTISVSLTEAEQETAVSEVMRKSELVPSAMRAALDGAVESFLASIRRDYADAIQATERHFRAIEVSIAEAWREPLESLSLLIELACRLMRTVQDYCAEHPTELQPKLLHVAARLHICSIHVAREIHTLMRCGYPDAAMARWRTLHEIVTVMGFLGQHGESCAASYVDHEAVQAFRDAKKYQSAAARLGHEPLTDAAFGNLQASYDAALARHGPAFRHDYGWAASALKLKKPTFTDIETAAGRSHMRPYSQLASDNVHAGIMGALYKLGTVQRGKLLLEPSPVGLEEPGQNTALSLAQMLAEVMGVCRAFDALVIVQAALAISDEASKQFVAVGKALNVKVAGQRRPRKRSSRANTAQSVP